MTTTTIAPVAMPGPEIEVVLEAARLHARTFRGNNLMRLASELEGLIEAAESLKRDLAQCRTDKDTLAVVAKERDDLKRIVDDDPEGPFADSLRKERDDLRARLVSEREKCRCTSQHADENLAALTDVRQQLRAAQARVQELEAEVADQQATNGAAVRLAEESRAREARLREALELTTDTLANCRSAMRDLGVRGKVEQQIGSLVEASRAALAATGAKEVGSQVEPHQCAQCGGAMGGHAKDCQQKSAK